MLIQRHEGYTGVLIDDLVTKGTNEPYRMFTSRAEHRLLFNHASAELRLAHHAEKHGLVSKPRLERIASKRKAITDWIKRLETTRGPTGTWAEIIRRDRTTILPQDFTDQPRAVRDEVIYRVSYQGYLAREERQIEKLSRIEGIRIPKSLNFLSISGLRKESALKLTDMQPMTLGQASRISGVNPADIVVLLITIEAGRGREAT